MEIVFPLKAGISGPTPLTSMASLDGLTSPQEPGHASQDTGAMAWLASEKQKAEEGSME